MRPYQRNERTIIPSENIDPNQEYPCRVRTFWAVVEEEEIFQLKLMKLKIYYTENEKKKKNKPGLAFGITLQ